MVEEILKPELKMGGGLPSQVSNLDPSNKRKIIQEYIAERIEANVILQKTAENALIDAINRAKMTQDWILLANKIMFYFGIFLLLSAIYVAVYTDKSAYSILFGGVGFLQIVASFFIGSMERSQKAISDLIQVEVIYLNYFEQVALWENYASKLDNSYNIDNANIEKAADKIHSCAKDSLVMLQEKVERGNIP
jgi:hypothetical protein